MSFYCRGGLLIKFIGIAFPRCSSGTRVYLEDLCFLMRHFYDVLLGMWHVLLCVRLIGGTVMLFLEGVRAKKVE